MATATGQLKPVPLDATCRKKEIPVTSGTWRIKMLRLIIIVTCRTACLLVENILLLRTVLLAPKISQQEEKEGTANNAYGK